MFTNHNYQSPTLRSVPAVLPDEAQAAAHSPVFGASPNAIAALHARLWNGYNMDAVPPPYASGNIGASGQPSRWQQMGRVTDYKPISAPTSGSAPAPTGGIAYPGGNVTGQIPSIPTDGAQPLESFPSVLSGVRAGGPLASS